MLLLLFKAIPSLYTFAVGFSGLHLLAAAAVQGYSFSLYICCWLFRSPSPCCCCCCSRLFLLSIHLLLAFQVLISLLLLLFKAIPSLYTFAVGFSGLHLLAAAAAVQGFSFSLYICCWLFRSSSPCCCCCSRLFLLSIHLLLAFQVFISLLLLLFKAIPSLYTFVVGFSGLHLLAAAAVQGYSFSLYICCWLFRSSFPCCCCCSRLFLLSIHLLLAFQVFISLLLLLFKAIPSLYTFAVGFSGLHFLAAAAVQAYSFSLYICCWLFRSSSPCCCCCSRLFLLSIHLLLAFQVFISLLLLLFKAIPSLYTFAVGFSGLHLLAAAAVQGYSFSLYICCWLFRSSSPCCCCCSSLFLFSIKKRRSKFRWWWLISLGLSHWYGCPLQSVSTVVYLFCAVTSSCRYTCNHAKVTCTQSEEPQVRNATPRG